MKFKDLQIIDRIQKSLQLTGYVEPTPIQVDAIPVLLEGKDLLASAQTGTGKTAAFAIPILQQIYATKDHKANRKIEALILTPTRELALQIHENFKVYGKYVNVISTTIYGGVSQKRQQDALKRGVDVLIATPGRLQDLMDQGIIKLHNVKYLVLDEADQMLDMGFIKDVLKIVDATPKKRQTMLFSATMPKQIEQLSKQILKDPVRIAVKPVTETLDTIEQKVYFVPKARRTDLLIDLIYKLKMKSVLVFMRTKHGANKLSKNLMKLDIQAESIHGDKSQASRERALASFKKGDVKILVATDIAARGIDIDALDYVINFDLPEVPETYIHRIGRTGRAGLQGIALSFVDPQEMKLLNQIEKHINTKIAVEKHIFMTQTVEVKADVNQPKKEMKPARSKVSKRDSNLPDYLKFNGHKPKSKKNKKQNETFVEYQKKTNPYYQTKQNKSKNK